MYNNNSDINHYILELEENLRKSKLTVTATLEAHATLTSLTIKQLRDRLQQVQADRDAARNLVDIATQAADRAVKEAGKDREILSSFKESYLAIDKKNNTLHQELEVAQQGNRDLFAQLQTADQDTVKLRAAEKQIKELEQKLHHADQALQQATKVQAGKVDIAALKTGMNRYQGKELNKVLVEVDRALRNDAPIEDKLTPWATKAATFLFEEARPYIDEYDTDGNKTKLTDLLEEAATLLPGFGVNL